MSGRVNTAARTNCSVGRPRTTYKRSATVRPAPVAVVTERCAGAGLVTATGCSIAVSGPANGAARTSRAVGSAGTAKIWVTVVRPGPVAGVTSR